MWNVRGLAERNQADERGGGDERGLADLEAPLDEHSEREERDDGGPFVLDDLLGDDDGGAGDGADAAAVAPLMKPWRRRLCSWRRVNGLGITTSR
jgi:hypothetical protein